MKHIFSLKNIYHIIVIRFLRSAGAHCGRALDWGLKVCWFEPHNPKSHCTVSLSKTQDCCILADQKSICPAYFILGAAYKFFLENKERSELDSRTKGCGFEPHQRHCIVSFNKTHYPLLNTGSTQEDPS